MMEDMPRVLQVLTNAAEVQTLDLMTCTAADADFTSEFRLLASAAASSEPAPAVHAVVLWFDTHFSERFCAQHPVTLSTSPHAPPTHWAQTVLTLRCVPWTASGWDPWSTGLRL